MKSTIYTIEDDWMGIILTIEGELTDWEDDEPPTIIINEISHNETPLSMWTLSESYIKHLVNKIFQQWCMEGAKK